MQFVSASLSLIEMKLKMARKRIAHTQTMQTQLNEEKTKQFELFVTIKLSFARK